MTFFAADPIASGMPYDVVAVDGEPPTRLDQFLGETSFVISKGDTQSHVCGVGASHGTDVRFQEKDISHDGKDVRTWQIAMGGSGFVAATMAAF